MNRERRPDLVPARAVPSRAMPARLPRWTWLLVLPMLVGALLLMHGLDAGAGDHHTPTAAAAPAPADSHVHTEHGAHLDTATSAAASSSPEDGQCLDCLAGHVMAACMAIITTIVGVGLIRRRLGGGFVVALAAPLEWARSLIESVRPPDPAWVRLSVMRC